jgi:epsin
MDRLESLTSTLQNITMYDLKSMYEQAKNVVLNVSEMEAKVREATNDDPWGASSTLMQEIAQGTFHFQYFNEIMPSIYSRFMEKEARQWRQIYKALQLLEYLIKHGSERVVDDARSHISTLKMLRNFHYIDDKGKDEGINVRNRSRELVELLSDVEKIRGERRKAKTNKNKYTGVGNDGFSGTMSFEGRGGSRYGGFGSEGLGGGGGGGGSSSYENSSPYRNDYGGSSNRADSGGWSNGGSSRRQFEEYNAGDDEETSTPVRSNSVRSPARKATAPPPAAAPAPAPQPVVDLLGGFDDDTFGAPAPVPAPVAVNKALPAVATTTTATSIPGFDDDDFADFQAAPVAAAPPRANANLMSLLSATPAQPTAGTGFIQPQQAAPPAYGGMGMNVNTGMSAGMGGRMGMGMGMGTGGMGMGMGGHRQTPSFSSPGTMMQPQQPMYGGGAAMRPAASLSPQPAMGMGGGKPAVTTPATKPAGGNFDDLWSMSLGATSTAKAGGAALGKSIKDLEKEKANAGLWGGQQQQRPVGSAPLPAFGAFGNGAPPSSSSNGDADDLLL